MHSEHNTHAQYKVIDLRKPTEIASDNYEVQLNWYEKKGNNLIGEEPIKNLTVDDVLKIFDAPFWNKIYQCWAITPAQAQHIQAKAKHQLDTDKYSYFIELYKVN
jgi:hypothetical protein